MTQEKQKHRYLKVAVLTVVIAGTVIGATLGTIRDRDRIDFDIQRLKTSVGIANALYFKVSFHEGVVVMKRGGVKASREVGIPTLKDVAYKDKTVQVTFKSLFFKKTIALDKTPALQVE
ncbi:MAG: hypothetical protein CR984_00905 [Proteobacteria bacterium]|nr:MAG: hypothetical protein CR984_00905 [Pseudomonadota bacterium]